MTKPRWWVGRVGKGFACPMCRKQLKGGGNGALASHMKAAHPIADWTNFRRNPA